jgi:hypothetical protein
MIRAWLVVSLASAGIWRLTSPGWGLLTAAVLVYVMWGQLTAFAGALGRVSAGLAAVRRAVRSAVHAVPARGIRGILG